MVNRLFSSTPKRASLGGAAALLIGVALMGQALGFLRNRLISTNFTVVDPGSSDAFFAAFQIPDFFFYTISAGALGVAFIPFLSDRLANGDKKGVWQLASSLLNVLLLVMGAVSIIILLFAEPLMGALAPDLPQENFNQAVTIMRIIAFNPLLFALSGILTSVQQTFGRFFFYAMAPLFYNVSIIISVYVFRDNIGIIGLGIGALFGGILQLSVACLGLIGLGFRYKPTIAWKNANFRHMVRQLPPRSLDQGIDQVNSIVEVNRAQALGVGPVSFYNFALTLQNVPIMLVGNAIAIAAFPRLTERLSQGRPDLFRKDFLQILRAMIWMTMPVVVVGYFSRGYLARLIFGDVAPEVALIFGYLTASIFFRIIYSMLSRYFYAHKDTKTPLFVSVFAIGLNIYLAFTLARADAYGIAGLAMAQSITAATEVGILFLIILSRDFKLFDAKFWGGIVKILSVTGFSIVTAYVMVSFFPLTTADRGIVTLGSKLGLIGLSTLLVHTSISALFGLEEAKNVLTKAKQFIWRPVKV
ncbi:MAG: lipid II flippase MurJ [Candidatus Saccharibacteria bacterium]|nr:lipid II flippase MurJ [Candidatus Saccharibacteria bacterium]